MTYISNLHQAAEELLAVKGQHMCKLEFWYGVESTDKKYPDLFLPNERTIALGRRSFFWRTFLMPRFLKRHGFALAHFNYTCPIIKSEVKYVVTVHDVLFLKNKRFFSASYRLTRGFFFWLSVRRADSIITVSDQSRQDIAKYLNPRNVIHVIPNAPNKQSSTENVVAVPVAGLAAESYILTVGRVEPRKNYPRLARCFHRSKISMDGAKLVIVGFCSREHKDEIEKIQGVPGVVWLNNVSDRELKWLYTHAKGFVYPSYCEGFGIPVVEAMAFGLLVAVSKTYPLYQVLEVVEKIFDPNSDDELLEAIQYLWHSHKKVEIKSVSVARSFSWSKSAEQYFRCLNSIVDRK